VKLRPIGIHIVAVIVLYCHIVAIAGDAGQESPFSVGVGARALAMGGGLTSLADDALAVFYNPAGLAAMQFQEVSFMHMTLFEGTACDYASWAYPVLSLGGFAAAYMRIGTDDIIKRSSFVETGSFDYSTSQFLISYGRRLHGGLALGVSLKVVNQTLDTYSDYGVGLDFGMTASLHKNLSAGIIIRDMIPASIKLDTTAELTPLSVVGGLSLRQIKLTDRAELTASFELEKVENRSTKVHTGAEAVFDGAYALRAGYDRDNFSFGAGLTYRRLKIDYAYKFLEYVNDSHRFSLSFLIGTSISEQERQKQQEEQQRGTALVADERRRQFAFYKEKADMFYDRFRLDSALTYYHRALAFEEDNEEIIGTIAAIENARRIQLEQEQGLREIESELHQSIENYYTQAQSFLAKQYYAAALDMLDLIFDIDREHAGAKRLKQKIEGAMTSEIAQKFETAQAAERAGQYLTAIEAYIRILHLDPSNLQAQEAKQRAVQNLALTEQLNQAIQLFKAGKYIEARHLLHAVLAIDPSEPVALEYLKRIDQSLAQPPTLEDIQKDKATWQLYLDGLRHMRDKEYEKAIEAWEKVLQVYPNNSNTLDNLEQARLRLKSQDSQ
jgi:tetratricopeptide (TPR) repeat protein